MYVHRGVHCMAICMIRQLLCNDDTTVGHVMETQHAREERGSCRTCTPYRNDNNYNEEVCGWISL